MRIVVIALTLLMMSPELCAAQRARASEPSITVRGQGRVQAPPDYANVTVVVETKARTAADAAAAHKDRATRAANTLRDMKDDGIELIRSNFSLAELRTPPPPSSPSKGVFIEFQASTSFELKTSRLENIDAAITKIASTGLFQVRNLRFALNDDNPASATARRRAVANAHERAETYADAAGVQLGEVLKIEDLEEQAPVLFSARAPAARTEQVIPPEGLTVSTSVAMTWRIVTK